MKFKFSLIFFLLLMRCASNYAWAQGLCNVGGGSFDISPSEGCAPLTVNITNHVQNSFYIGYQPYYDGVSDSPQFRNLSSTVYNSAGNFTLLQYGATSAGLFTACQKVKVYETGAPIADYTSCGGGRVYLVLSDNTVLNVYDQVEIKWGDNTTDIWKKGDSLTLDHIYLNTSSSPIITIRGVYNSNTACSGGATTSLAVSFQQPQLNSIQVKSLDMKANGSLELTYAGVSAIKTQIQYSTNGTNYTTHGTRSTGGSNIFYRMTGLNADQVYQVKLSSSDLCGSQLDSDVSTSMVISGSSSDEKNMITWNKYPVAKDFIEYELFRDGVSIKTFSIDETSYTDVEVQCGDQFEYYVIAKTQKITSTSAPKVVATEIAQPKPITQASVSVNGDKLIAINAVIPGAGPKSTYELTIERADAGSIIFKKIATVQNQSEFADMDVSTSEFSYCYRLSYQNSCGQKLPATEPICSILLKNDFSSFTWTSEKPFLESIKSYDVLQVGKTSGLTTNNNQLLTSFRPKFSSQSDLEYTFQVQAISESGSFESYSNTLSYTRNQGVFVPDAFSPNGDGTNDELLAISSQLQSFNISIFNRWGQVVYYSDDILKGWDGNINGAHAPVGAYVYKVKFIDDIDQKVEKSGTFMLLR